MDDIPNKGDDEQSIGRSKTKLEKDEAQSARI